MTSAITPRTAASALTRPLPSGRIDRRQAAALGSLLWVLGLAAGRTASWSLGVWHCGAVATTLAGCVLAYDLGGKRTVLGPPLMGACRSLNVLLGMVCTRAAPDVLGLARLVAWRGGRDRRLCRGHHLVCPAGGGHQPTQPLAGSDNRHGLRDLAACWLRDPGCCGWFRSLRWTDPLDLAAAVVAADRAGVATLCVGHWPAVGVTHSGRRETRDPHLNSAGRRHLSGDRGPLRGAGRAQSVASVSGPGPLGVFDLRIAGTQTTHRQHTGIAGLP